MDRIIGDYGDLFGDRLLLVIGGLHGNEHSGVTALEWVFEYLQKENIPFRGRLVGLRGNLAALSANRRYVDTDLNRLWSDAHIVKALKHPEQMAEYAELKALIETFQDLSFSRYQYKVFLDLHNTSAENGTFVLVEDIESTEFIFSQLHAPLIVGLHNGLLHTSVPYMHMHGFVSLAFESGKIGLPSSVHNHMLTIYQVLWLNGFMSFSDIPLQIRTYTGLLEQNAHLPARLQIEYCHKIVPEDHFQMRPGFKNFDWVKKDDHLADDRNGPVLAPIAGYMLMPLYQKSGADGFFLVNEATSD
jgi:succinylglutamate desuccinylase